jgi:hypothetical protein
LVSPLARTPYRLRERSGSDPSNSSTEEMRASGVNGLPRKAPGLSLDGTPWPETRSTGIADYRSPIILANSGGLSVDQLTLPNRNPQTEG